MDCSTEHPERACDCRNAGYHRLCRCPVGQGMPLEIPDFSEPLPRRAAADRPDEANVVRVDLISVFLDGGVPTVLLVPIGGDMFKARLTPEMLGVLIAGLGAAACALIGSR